MDDERMTGIGGGTRRRVPRRLVWVGAALSAAAAAGVALYSGSGGAPWPGLRFGGGGCGSTGGMSNITTGATVATGTAAGTLTGGAAGGAGPGGEGAAGADVAGGGQGGTDSGATGDATTGIGGDAPTTAQERAAVTTAVRAYVEANARKDKQAMKRLMTASAWRTWSEGDSTLVMSGYTLGTVSRPRRTASVLVTYQVLYALYPSGRRVERNQPLPRVFILKKDAERGWLVDRGGDGFVVKE